jgi:hypothetical protein
MIIPTQSKFSDSFEQADDGSWRLKVGLSDKFKAPDECKWIKVSYTSTTDVYEFYTDNTESVLLRTVTITYQSSSKYMISTIGSVDT